MCRNIVLIGMPGCGKTTIGKILSKELSLKLYDMDKYIEEISNTTIPELFKIGEKHFRDIESQACKELSEHENIIISTGGGVVKRSDNIKNLRNNSLIIFIDRPVEKIIEDVNTSKRPLLKDGKEKLFELYNERYKLYKNAADIIILNDDTLESVIIKMKKFLK